MITKTKTRKAKIRLDQTPRSICVHCGEEAARAVQLPQAYQQGNDLILIENVPMKLCESCGQSYLEGVTLDEISKVLQAPAQYTESQMVKVARLP
jgi:YgiT-type zinc finger domain-containing protein